jgi:hypothetical protein
MLVHMVPYTVANESRRNPAIGQAKVLDEAKNAHARVIGRDERLKFSKSFHQPSIFIDPLRSVDRLNPQPIADRT